MSRLEDKLKGVRMKDIQRFLEENEAEMIKEYAFADYMRGNGTAINWYPRRNIRSRGISSCESVMQRILHWMKHRKHCIYTECRNYIRNFRGMR